MQDTTTIEIGNKRVQVVGLPFDIGVALNSQINSGFHFIGLNVIMSCEKMSGETTQIIEKQYININNIDLFY